MLSSGTSWNCRVHAVGVAVTIEVSVGACVVVCVDVGTVPVGVEDGEFV